MAGTGGMGGTHAIVSGLWTGSGVNGTAVPFDICFNVSEDGTALTEGLIPDEPCAGWKIDVTSPIDGCFGSLGSRSVIPIVDGSFSLDYDTGVGVKEIHGTFDGNSASGEVSSSGAGGPCQGDWEAHPGQ